MQGQHEGDILQVPVGVDSRPRQQGHDALGPISAFPFLGTLAAAGQDNGCGKVLQDTALSHSSGHGKRPTHDGPRGRYDDFINVIARISDPWIPATIYEDAHIHELGHWMDLCMAFVRLLSLSHDFDYRFEASDDGTYERDRQRFGEDTCL